MPWTVGVLSSTPVPLEPGATRALVHHESRHDSSDSTVVCQRPAAHRMMSPVVTGECPSQALCAGCPFPNRTGCFKVSMK